jgi:hypothetical protein
MLTLCIDYRCDNLWHAVESTAKKREKYTHMFAASSPPSLQGTATATWRSKVPVCLPHQNR